MSQQPIHICFAADNHFAQHLSVVITSILVNEKESLPHFHILDGGIDVQNKTKISALKSIKNFEIEFIPTNIDSFDQYAFPKNSPFSPAIFYRFCIPEIFTDLDKILYIDVDTVVLKSLTPFYQTDLQNNYFGMISEWDASAQTQRLETKKYFNSGVMLFNLPQCRKDHITNQLISGIDTVRDQTFPDQDIINLLFSDRIMEFPLIYNAQIYKYLAENISYLSTHLDEIVILHYTTKVKPWSKYKNPFEFLYLQYLKLTPWKNQYFAIKIIKIWGAIFPIETLQQMLFSCTYYIYSKTIKKIRR